MTDPSGGLIDETGACRAHLLVMSLVLTCYPMSLRHTQRQPLPGLGRRGGEAALLGLADNETPGQVPRARQRPLHRRAVAPCGAGHGGDVWLGWAGQAVGWELGREGRGMGEEVEGWRDGWTRKQAKRRKAKSIKTDNMCTHGRTKDRKHSLLLPFYTKCYLASALFLFFFLVITHSIAPLSLFPVLSHCRELRKLHRGKLRD